MINAYQEVLAAVRRADPSTKGRIRCWMVARGPAAVWFLVLSYVQGEIEAEVIWSGEPHNVEVEFLADALNAQNGVGEPIVTAMYKKYIKTPGASFLSPDVLPRTPLLH